MGDICAFLDLNQLTRENNADIGKTYVYTYDKSGNIQTKQVYAYTTGTLGTLQDTITYTYGNTAWKDQLTNYDGTAISYDASGNPTNWIGNLNTLTWNGRQLSSIAMPSNQNINFKYNSDGIRTYKYFIDNDEMYLYQHDYMLEGSTIVGEKVNYFSYYNGSWTKYKYYYYDENGSPIGMNYEGKDYYFQKNILGDIEAIYQGSTKVVQYVYDAWGNVLSVTGTLASTIGQENPFRYRGYYYDTETGLYYLQSRYYDPQVGRFISADDVSVMSLDQDNLIQYNLYAYCLNNPVNRFDESGNWSLPNWAKVAIGAATTVAAVAITVATGGAAAPILIGVATSTLSSAAIGYITGGVQGMVDGACDGFMWGGISALGTSVVSALPKVVKAAKAAKTDPLKQALKQLDASGLRPGQTEISRSKVMKLVNNFDSVKAQSSVCSIDGTKFLVEGHHTTVASTILGKGTCMNMGVTTSQLPSVTNVYWAKRWYEFGKTVIKIVD